MQNERKDTFIFDMRSAYRFIGYMHNNKCDRLAKFVIKLILNPLSQAITTCACDVVIILVNA